MDGTKITTPVFNAKSAFYNLLQQKLDMSLLDEALLPFVGDWKPIEGFSAAVLLAKITLSLSRSGNITPWPLMHSALALRGVSVSFYARKAIYVDAVVRDVVGNIGHAGFLVFPDHVYSVPNKAESIHAINAAEGFTIKTSQQALAYLKLHCWIICADYGPFQVIGDMHQLRRVFDNVKIDTLAPMSAKKEKDKWALAANVLYGHKFFRATFLLDSEGVLEMEDEEALPLAKHGTADDLVCKGVWQVHENVKYFYEKGGAE